jgi:DNA-binding CsgD family transcriptional regulator
MAAAAAELVGRERELAAVGDFLEGKMPASALVVEGEPGIGKTTLWQWAVDDSVRRGFRTLSARPAQSEAKLAFSSLADLFGDALDNVLPQLAPPQRRALEIALLIADADGARADRRAVAAGLLSALRALAAERPLLVAIDDLQWLDASSAAALEYGLRRLRDEPISILLARRADEGDDALPIERALPADRLLRVTLGPLDFVALNGVIHARLGTILARPLLHRIHDLSGGNPFFALELARDPERLKPGRGLPPTLDVLVRSRIGELPAEARAALFVAAAVTEPTVDLVEHAVGARDALAAAEAAGIVAVERGAVTFQHPLLASAAYAAPDPAERREAHRRLADLVRGSEERARHLAAAATGADEAVAAALEEGATHARARGAPAAAADLSMQAAELTPPEDEPARLRRRSDAGYFLFESGDSRQALALLEDAVANLSPGPDRARVLVRLARVRSYADDVEAATQLFLRAADEADGDSLTKAHALEGAATQLFRRREHLEDAVDHATAAAALARKLGDDALLGEALGAKLLAEATLGRPHAGRTLEEALTYQGAAEAKRILAQPQWAAAIARMWWDEPAAVRHAYEELVERGRQLGDEGSLAYVYVMLAQADALLGDYGRAEADAAAAREIAEQAGQETLIAYALAVRALVDVERGREPDARAAANEALSIARRTQSTPALHVATAAHGLLALATGEAVEAVRVLEPVVRFARAEQIREPGLTRFVTDHVEALVEVGRLDEATELLDWYAENAQKLGRSSAIAASLRCRALIAAAAGRLDEALGLFEQAFEEHELAPIPFDRARTVLAYGSTLRRAKRKADARTALEQAIQAFDVLGAGTFAARARAELERIGGRRRSQGDLTATERQIAELVAEGRSNKEVAAALYITVKTVEANLSKVYAKLGIRSRTELARRLGEGEAAVKP